MNMISTGAFPTEMDASVKQETTAERFVRAWEKKNARVARAGGVSLMALSLAACGSDDDAAVVAVVAEPVVDTTTVVTVPVVPVAQSFTLTSSIFDTPSGGDGDDTFTATSATLHTTDTITGGAGTDTLSYTDNSAAGTSMALPVMTGIEKVSIANIAGVSANAVTESGSVVYSALAPHSSITMAGLALNAGATGATAAQVATAFAGGVADSTDAGGATGAVMSGTLSGYTVAAGTNSNTVDFTSSTAASNVADLAATGAAVDGHLSTQVLTFAIVPGNADNTIAIQVDGKTATSSASGGTNAAALATLVNSLAANMNAAAGKTIANSDGAATIVVTGGQAISNFAKAGTSNTTTMTPTFASYDAVYTLATNAGASGADATAGELNGVNFGTAAITATTLDAAGDGLATAINLVTGESVATYNATNNKLTISADEPYVLTSVALGSTVINATAVTNASTGDMAAAAPTITLTQGSAATTVGNKAMTVDGSSWTGVTGITNSASKGDITVTGLAAINKVTVNGITSATADTTIQHTALAVAGTADSTTIDIVNSSSTGNISVGDASNAGIESITVNSTGTSNKVADIISADAASWTIDSAGKLDVNVSAANITTAGSITVKGAGKVTLNTLEAGFNTVDASGNSGGLVAAIGGNTDTVLTGSTAADKITASTTDTIAAAQLLAVDAGLGTDTLVIGDAADVASAADAARYTNFEKLDVSTSQDMSLVTGITAVHAGGDSISLTKMSAAQTANISIEDDGGNDAVNALVVALNNATGLTDSVTITTKSVTATQDVDITELNVDNIETVNIVASTGTNASGDTAIDFLANNADEVTALNISGSADVTLTVEANVLDVAAVAIDASGITGTGDFTLTDSSGALVSGSSVTGTANADTFGVQTGTGISYSGGGGKDGFTSALASLAASGANDTSINGGDAVDTLTLSDTANTSITDNHFTNISNMEKLTSSGTNDVTITTGAAWAAAFDSVTITTAAIANEKSFVYNGGLYDGDTTITAVMATNQLGDATGEHHTINTGDGKDTITLTSAGFVSAASASIITVGTDAGDDTLTISIGTIADDAIAGVLTIDMGTGADTVTMTKVNGGDTISGINVSSGAVFSIASGDSLVTAYDKIVGFDMGGSSDTSDTLDFAGTGAVTDFTQSTDSGSILSHALSNGVATFDDAATFDTALVINSGNLSDVTSYLAANTATNDVAAFSYDRDGDGTAESTFVFHNTTIDSLVFLQDIVVTAIGTAATETAGTITIA
jgi:hypothetical protein